MNYLKKPSLSKAFLFIVLLFIFLPKSSLLAQSAAFSPGPDAANLQTDQGVNLQPGDLDKAIFKFNAFYNTSPQATLNAVSFYVHNLMGANHPSEVIAKVKIYEDQNPFGQFGTEDILKKEVLVDTQGAWTGTGPWSVTLDLTGGSEITVPTADQTNLGFIVIDIKSTAPMGASFVPYLDNNSFSFSDASLTTAANNNLPFNKPGATTAGKIMVGQQMGAPVVISELQLAGTNNTQEEFIEIYNRTPNSFTLDGWDLAYSTDGTTWTQIVNDLPLNTSVSAGGFVLFLNPSLNGQIGQVTGNFNGNSNWSDLSETGGFIALRDPGDKIADKLGYGTVPDTSKCEGSSCAPAPPANNSLERKPFGPATAEMLSPGGSAETAGNGYDTNNNSFDFVVQSFPKPQNLSSPTEAPPQEIENIGIRHIPISKATSGQPLIVHAQMGDPMTPMNQLTAELYYLTQDTDPSDNTFAQYSKVSGIYLGNGYWQFTTAENVGSGSNGMHYFLYVKGNSGEMYMSASPSADLTCINNQSCDTALIAQNPFVVNGVSAGTYTLSGTVKESGTNNLISEAVVFLEGSEYGTTTDANGNFSLPNVRQDVYNLIVSKEGYFEEMVLDLYVNSNLNLGDILLTQGQGGGLSGDTNKPHIIWTAPSDGMAGIPPGDSNFKIFIGFDKDIDSSTFNAINVYLTTDGTNPINGTTLEYSNDPNSRPSDYPPDPYLGIINLPQGGLNENTTYYVVVSDALRDTSGNPIEGNSPQGGYIFSFTTGKTFTGQETFGQGAIQPPFVLGTQPFNGAIDVPKNTKMAIKFTEPLDPQSVTPQTIKLYKVVKTTSGQEETQVQLSQSNFSLDTTKTIVLISPPLLESSAYYEIRVTGAVRSSSGVWLGNPGTNENTTSHIAFVSNFKTGSSTDTTGPAILATLPAQGEANVAVNKGKVEIQFSEAMDPITINANTVALKRGSTAVTTKVVYNPMQKSVSIIPLNILSTQTNYTVFVKSGQDGVKDLAGNQFDGDPNQSGSQDFTAIFTTSAQGDTEAPSILFANGDDWSIAITFTEAMNSARPGESNYASSVLNPSNYILKWGDPGTVASSGTVINLSNTAFNYDFDNNTIFIEGIGLDPAQTSGKDYWLQISNATDLAGNTISGTGDTFQMPISNSSETKGFLGPGGPEQGGMVGPDMEQMGMMSAGAFPANMMAGKSSTYFVTVPISNGFESGGRIVITFPDGFDVSGAMPDSNSPANNDINGPGPGTVAFKTSGVTEDSNASTQGGAPNDGVTVNTSSNTVTVWLTATQNISQDIFNFDLKGIVNTSIPKGFDTPGYSVDIKVLKANGTLSESISHTMPFFIVEPGNLTLGGTITLSEAPGAAGTLEICLDSPATGTLCQELSFGASDTSKAYSFTGLSPGDYFIFTKPTVTLNNKDYLGITIPEPIHLSSSINNKNFTLTKLDATTGADITILLNGNFSTNGVNDNVDVFASSAQGFRIKPSVTPNTDDSDGNNSVATNATYHLYLPDGRWMVGIGPALPPGPTAGPPPTTDWVPPLPIEVAVSNNGTSITESSGTPNDGTLVFNISAADKLIYGKVTKEDGTTGIPDAEVYAYSPTGATTKGAHSVTEVSGNFVLRVAEDGTYKIGVFKPGLPPVPEKTLIVDSNGNVTDPAGNQITQQNPFIIKVKKPDFTISGKVTDGQNPVAYTPVWADRRDAPGHTETKTNSSGNFILYVENGTWEIRAFIPNIGEIGPEVVIINNSSETQNLSPSFGTTYQISGNVTINGQPRSQEPIRAVKFDNQGNYLGQEFSSLSDAQGNYTINVPPGIYRVDIWTPEFGEIEALPQGGDQFPNSPASLQVTNSNVSNVNISIGASQLKTVIVTFTNGAGYSGKKGFVDIEKIDPATKKPTGLHKTLEIANVADNTSLQLPDGDYQFFAHVTGLGEFIADEMQDQTTPDYVDISTENTVHFALPDANTQLITISGTVTDENSQPIAKAWVWIDNPQSSYRNGVQTNNLGQYSLQIPKTSGNYKMGVNKPGYLSSQVVEVSGSADATQDFSLTSANLTIEGRVYYDSNGNGSYDNGEEISFGFVWAQETTTDTSTNTPVNSDGTYQLPVKNGSWQVYAVGDGYAQTPYRVGGNKTAVAVSGASVTGINISLDKISGWQGKSKSKPIVPASGGILDDTGTTGTKVKLTIPPSALGSSSAQGQLSVKETTSVVKTSSATPLGMKGKEVKAYDNSNQAITTLNQNVDLELVYYKSDIETAGIKDYSKLKTLVLGYWNETDGEWVSTPTVKTAYTKEAGATEFSREADFNDFVNNLISNPSYYSDYKIALKGTTDHFTIFGAINPTDSTAPSSPTGLQATAGNNQVVLDWSDNTESDLMEYEIYRSTNSGVQALDTNQVNTSQVTSSTFTDNSAQNWTSYYYVITAVDDSGNESSTSTEVQVCPNPGVAHGTVASSCAITCDSGYSLDSETKTCNIIGSSFSPSGGGGGGGFKATQKQETTETQPEKTSETETQKQTTQPTPTEEIPQKEELSLEKIITKPISEMTVEELKTAISQLSTLVQKLQAELAQLIAEEKEVKFTQTLKYGMEGEEVRTLQACLAKDPEVYPEGLVTGYFGPLTKAAVIRFQEKYREEVLAPWGITEGTGLVGKTTRAKLNQLCP